MVFLGDSFQDQFDPNQFQETRIRSYKVQYLGYNPDAKLVELGKLEDTFSKEVR